MKITDKINKKSWVIGFALLAAAGCSDDNPVTPTTPPAETGQYLVAAVFDVATYFLTVDDLEDATVTISPTGNNGLEYSNTFSHFVNNGTIGLLGLKYGQGGAHVGAGFTIGASGRAEQVGTDFEIPSGFTTAGSFGTTVITARSAQTLTDGSIGAVINSIDMANGNRLVSRSLSTGNLPGLGARQASLIGIEDAGGGSFFTSLQVTDAPIDSVYVAKLDQNLNILGIYGDDRIGLSGGGWRSARYSQIGTVDNGDTYVFSGAGGISATTTKKGGALVIRSGATDFDSSYYWDIETAADGYRFRRVYHVTEDYFLIEFYNEISASGTNDQATLYGIARMSTRTFSWLTGFPAKTEIVDRGTSWPFNYNGKSYVGVQTVIGSPAIYAIDPVTATATKGVTVADVTSIGGIAFITD